MELQSKENQLAQVHRVLSDEIISTNSTPSVASCRAKFENFATPSYISATPKIAHSESRHNHRRVSLSVALKQCFDLFLDVRFYQNNCYFNICHI